MKTKRILAALLAVIMTFTCMGAVAFAALPAGANYDDGMDSYTSGWPTGMKDKTGKGLYTYYENKSGVTGTASDKALKWLIGIGNGGPYASLDATYIHPDWSYGMSANLGGNKIMDTTVAFNMDFKVEAKTVWTTPFFPVFYTNGGTGSRLFPIAIQLREDRLAVTNLKSAIGNSNSTISGSDYNGLIIKDLGEVKAGTWMNIGAVIKHSSTKSLEGGNALIIDLYVNSEKVHTFTSNSNDYAGAALTQFLMPAVTTAVGSVSTRFDSRKEYVYVDNFYLGNDVARACPTDLWIEKTIPAEGTLVPVDGTISIVTNQNTVNFDEIGNDSIWLEKKDGTVIKFANVTKGTTVTAGDTITGTLSENLDYSEEYTLKQSNKLKNSVKRSLQTKNIKFVTESMFPVKAEVVDYTKSTGTASADLAFKGNSAAMKLVMAAYDQQGVMVDYTVKDVAANQSTESIDVTYSNDETIKIFAVDNIGDANLVMEPIIDGGRGKGHTKSAATTVSVGEATTLQQIISVDGEIDLARGWVVTKVAKKGNESSANIDDYLSIDAVQADDNGAFSFAGRVKEAKATYVYKATAVDSNNTDSGEVEYILETGNELLSLKLDGKRATLRGNDYYLKLKNADVRGMFVEFTIPYKAMLLMNGEELVSGTSRIDFTNTVKFVVRPEMGEEKVYNIIVDVEVTDDYDDRNENLTVIVDGTTKGEGDEIVDPGEYVEDVVVFSDVKKGYWAEEAIEALYEKGIVGGVGDGTFNPNALITREEFASMVSKAFGFAPKNTRMVFEDVRTGAWYENAVYALAENGIVSGVEKYKFGVGQTITRQDMTVILYNVIKDSAVEDVREAKTFKDQAKIASYAASAVEFMYKAGYVSGMEDGTFAPTAGTTKAMAAYMIYSLTK